MTKKTKLNNKNKGRFLSFLLVSNALINPVYGMTDEDRPNPDWTVLFPEKHQVDEPGSKILNYLDDRSLARLAQVNKYLASIARQVRGKRHSSPNMPGSFAEIESTFAEKKKLFSLVRKVIGAEYNEVQCVRDRIKRYLYRLDPFPKNISQNDLNNIYSILDELQKNLWQPENYIGRSYHQSLIEAKDLKLSHPGLHLLRSLLERIELYKEQHSFLSDLLSPVQEHYKRYLDHFIDKFQARKVSLESKVIISGEGFFSLKKECGDEFGPGCLIHPTDRTINSYRISQEMARFLIAMDSFGSSFKNNISGTHTVQFLSTKDDTHNGVFFKSGVNILALPVGMESAMYWFAKVLFGRNMAPTSLVVLNDVEIGVFQPESPLKSLYWTLCICPSREEQLTEKQFIERYPGYEKEIEITQTSHVIQTSLGIHGVNIQDFILGCGQGQYDYADLDLRSFGEQIILSIFINPQDYKADNLIVRTDLGKPYPIVGIDNDMALLTGGIIQKEKEINHTKKIIQTINVKNILYCFKNQMEDKVDPQLKEYFLQINPELVLLKWLGNLYLQEKEYLDLQKSYYDKLILTKENNQPRHETQSYLSKEQFTNDLRLPVLLDFDILAQHLAIFKKLKAILNDHGDLSHWGLFHKVHSGAASCYKKFSSIIFNLKNMGLNHPIFKNKPNFKKAYEELINDIEHCKPESEKFNPILATYDFIARSSNVDLKQILREELHEQTSNSKTIREELDEVEDSDYNPNKKSKSKKTIRELILFLIGNINLDKQYTVIPFMELGFFYFKDILQEVMQKKSILASSSIYYKSWQEPFLLLRLMKERSQEHIIGSLLDWGWDPKIIDPASGNNLFHYWVIGNYSEKLLKQIVEIYLKSGKEIALDNKFTIPSPLDLAMLGGHENAFTSLVNYNLMKFNLGISYDFYKNHVLAKDRKGLSGEFRQSFIHLIACNPDLKWKISWHHLLPTSSQDLGHKANTASSGEIIVPTSVLEQIRDKKTNGEKRGNHEVTSAKISDPLMEYHLYFKFFPDLPGIEEGVGRLTRELLGFGAPYTELIKIGVSPIMVSQGIEGYNLLDVLLMEDLKKKNEILSNIDLESLSGLILVAMLINPEDGKPENYIVERHPIQRDKYRIVGVDNDHAFVPAIAREEDEKNEAPGAGPVKASVQVKSILYCLDQMNYYLPHSVIDKFLKMDPYAIITKWLEELKVTEQSYKILFKDNIRNDGFFKRSDFKGENDCYLKIPFYYKGIREFYEKFVHLQGILEDNKQKNITHIDLLEKLEHSLAMRYEGALKQKHLSPYERFKQVDGPFYVMQEDGSSKSVTKSGRIVAFHLPPKRTMFERIFSDKKEIHGLSEALDELDKSQKDINKTSLESLFMKLNSDNKEENRDRITIEDLEDPEKRRKILKQADFSKYEFHQQRALLTYLCKYHKLFDISIINCASLTNNFLAPLHLDHLQFLDIRGSQNVDNLCLMTLSNQAKQLRELTLSNILTLTDIGEENVFGILTGNPLVFANLQKLILSGCTALKRPYIIASNLEELNVANCVLLTDQALDWVVEHSENLKTLKFKNCPLIGEEQLRGHHPNFPVSYCNKIKSEIIDILESKDSVLKKINLTRYKIGTGHWGGVRKRNGKEYGTPLTSWDIYNREPIKSVGVRFLITYSLEFLQKLYLGNNDIGAAGIRALPKGNWPQLKVLDLGKNNIRDEDIISLIQGKWPQLEDLNLSNNKIGATGIKTLSTGNFTGLALLNLMKNRIEDDGAIVLANGNLPSLTSLILCDNNIGDDGAIALTNGNLHSLTSLILCDNNIGAKLRKELKKKYPQVKIKF